jgi:carbonic anhydrase
MTTIDTLIDRNKDFAANRFNVEASRMPTLQTALNRLKTLIISCADPRVDPTRVLELQPGDAVVLRNIGGRVTPGTLEMLGLLNQVTQVEGANPGADNEFNIVVLHHTDCGMKRLAQSPDMLAHYFQIDQKELPEEHVTDPRAAVAVDVATLKAIPALPAQWLISGLVYDVHTGLIDVVVPPTPIRA